MITHKIGPIVNTNELNWWLEKEEESIVLKCSCVSANCFPFKVLSVNKAGQGFIYNGLASELGLVLSPSAKLNLIEI